MNKNPFTFSPIFAPDIPALYGQGLSDYEILVRVGKVIADCVNKVNSFEELAKELEKALSDLDGYVKDEVIRVIEEMYNNGELEDILNDVLSEYFERATAPRFTQPETNRLFRICRKAHEFTNVNLSTETPHFSYCQGGCMFVREGITYFVGCFIIGANDSQYYHGDDCDIRIYRKYSGGWYFVKNAIKNVFHGNDIAYDKINDRFYITPSVQWVAIQGGGYRQEAMNTVYILDWDLNFTDEEAVTFPQVNKLSNVCCINGDVFVCSDGQQPTIYKVINFETPELEIEMNIDLTDSRYTELSKTFGLYGSGLCGNENYFFMGTTIPNAILRFNRITKKLDWIYGLTEFGNNHMFRYGEFENISIIDDTIYFTTSIQNNSVVHFLDYAQVFCFDYTNNSMLPNKCLTKQSNGEYIILNVGNPNNDASIDSEIFEISNPNGDANNYFPTLNEAIMYANSQNYYDTVEISIKTRNILEPLVFSTNKNIFIEGDSYYTNHSGESDLNLRYVHIGFVFVYGGNVTFQNVQIENRNYSGGSLSGDRLNYQIIIRNGIFAFRGGRIHITDRPTDDVLKTLDAFINWNKNIYINSNNGAGSLTPSNCDFVNSTVNTHGAYTATDDDGNVIG